MQSRTEGERKARFLMVAAPVAMTLFLLGSLAFLYLNIRIGGKAEGARARVEWESGCAAEFATLAETRAGLMGLEDVQVRVEGERVVLEATMPGNPNDAVNVPMLLTAPGELSVHTSDVAGGEPQGESLVSSVDVTSAYFDVGFSGHPLVELTLQPNAMKRLEERETVGLTYFVDGHPAGGFQSDDTLGPDDVEVQPQALYAKEDEVIMATNWLILFNSGPAPCKAERPAWTVLEAPGS